MSARSGSFAVLQLRAERQICAVSGLGFGVVRVVDSRHRGGGKHRDFVKLRADTLIATNESREVHCRLRRLPKRVSTDPKQEPDDRSQGVSDSLVRGVVATDARQCFAVIVGEKSFKRGGARPDSVELSIGGEQLDA